MGVSPSFPFVTCNERRIGTDGLTISAGLQALIDGYGIGKESQIDAMIDSKKESF